MESVLSQKEPDGDGRLLVVFDFDWSLVNENSDVFVLDRLAPEIAASLPDLRKTEEFKHWTEAMDECARRLHAMPDGERKGFTQREIEEAFRATPQLEPIRKAAHLAAASGNADVVIVSDANTEYIEMILRHKGLTDFFDAVHTNPAEWDESGRLRIRPFHPREEPPHGCPHCPRNMCKGRIVDRVRQPHHQRVFYVGDGSGDFCPCLRLRADDVVLARSEWALHKLCRDAQSQGRLAARLVPWNSETGDEVLSEMESFLRR